MLLWTNDFYAPPNWAYDLLAVVVGVLLVGMLVIGLRNITQDVVDFIHRRGR